jgi:hypothetical protein
MKQITLPRIILNRRENSSSLWVKIGISGSAAAGAVSPQVQFIVSNGRSQRFEVMATKYD